MNIEDLTIKQVKELTTMLNITTPLTPEIPAQSPASRAWKIGETYLIRTVTMIDTGKLVAITNQELVLEDAAWIADTGRFSDALKKAEFNEVEPFPDGEIIVGRGSIIDAVKIKKSPRDRK